VDGVVDGVLHAWAAMSAAVMVGEDGRDGEMYLQQR
jgi:hypothetical protein